MVPDNSEPPAAPQAELPKWSRWVAPIALACALIAVALAAWSLLRPVDAGTTTTPAAPAPAPGPPPATDQQIADAETRACSAFRTVRSAVALQTNADLDSDPVAQEVGVANARLSLAASASYLRARLDPATPPALAVAIRSFADQLDEVVMNQLAGVPNDDPAQAVRMGDTDAAMTRLADVCR